MQDDTLLSTHWHSRLINLQTRNLTETPNKVFAASGCYSLLARIGEQLQLTVFIYA